MWSCGCLFAIFAASFVGTNGQADSTRRCVVDIALVIDMSGSIKDTGAGNWDLQMSFIKNIISNLNIGRDETRLGAVTFGNRAELHFTMDQYNTKEEYLAAIDRIQYRGGNTNTTGGLKVANNVILSAAGGNRPEIMDLVLLITDGNPTRDIEQLPGVAAQIRARGVRIIGVGVTNQVNQAVFRDIVTQPFSENYFNVTDFSSLMSILDAVIFASCRTMPPTQAPAPTAPPPGACATVADIIFVVDASGSIGDLNFQKIRTFVKNVIQDLDIENGRVRVGLSMFSDDVQTIFNLNQYTSRLDVMDAVLKIPYTRGRTNTGSAIRNARISMLQGGNGGRPEAKSVVVMVTDGASNNKEETLREAFESKQQGIHTVVVAVGGWTDMEELVGMATYPYQKNVFNVDNADALEAIKNDLRDVICNNVNECLSNPCRNGGTCVDGIDSYICLCPSTYSGPNCDRRCRLASDIVFAMDASGSIGQPNFQKQVDFVKEVMQGINLNVDSKAALMTFSSNPSAKFYLNSFTSEEAIMNAMSFYYQGGTTNTAGALTMMRQDMFTPNRGDRSDRPNIGIILTDGRSNDEQSTWDEAMKTRDAGAHLIAVGIGNNVKDMEMKGIASEPVSANTFRVNSFDELIGAKDAILDAICNERNDCEPNPCQNNARCIDLIGGYQCECIEGYSGINCERNCDGRMDIVFAIDASGSIRNERFPYVVSFIESLIAPLEVREGRTRVGVLKWSDQAQVEFQLNKYANRQDVLHHIRHITFTGGRTHTSSALTRVKDEMFTQVNGDRDSAQNILIIVTDGNSNINPETTIPDAIDARTKGIHIIVVAVGTSLNLLELRGIASQPERQNVYSVDSYMDLGGLMTTMFGATCNDINECSSDPCRNGGQCVDGYQQFRCLCAADWSGETCTRQCRRQMDIVFLLDLSGSTDQVYDIAIAFTRRVIQGLPVRFNRARVGLVSFASTSTTNFFLDTYQTKEEILNAISFRIAGGETNTQDAIRRATDEVFTSSRGDRSGVDNAMIIITDGGSNMRREETQLQADRARGRDIELFVAPVGPDPNMAEVNGIASDPDSEHVYRAATSGEVQRAADELLTQLCQ